MDVIRWDRLLGARSHGDYAPHRRPLHMRAKARVTAGFYTEVRRKHYKRRAHERLTSRPAIAL
jgi:hypothetical protein